MYNFAFTISNQEELHLVNNYIVKLTPYNTHVFEKGLLSWLSRYNDPRWFPVFIGYELTNNIAMHCGDASPRTFDKYLAGRFTLLPTEILTHPEDYPEYYI